MTTKEQAAESYRRVNRMIGQLESFGAELIAQAEHDQKVLLEPDPILLPEEPVDQGLRAARQEHAQERTEWVRYTALLNEEIRNLSALLLAAGVAHTLLNPTLLQDSVMKLGLENEELSLARQRLSGLN